MKLFTSIILILLSFSAVFGQSTTSDQKAIVYIYGDSATNTLDKIKPTIFLDDEEIAQVRPEHYFIAIITPGEHTFHFKEKKRGGVKMTFEANKTYYFKVTFSEAKSRFLKASIRPTGFVEMQEGSARFVLDEIKPVDKENIINPQIAFLALPNK